MDAGAGGQGDREGHRGAVLANPDLDDPARAAGLEQAASRPPRHRTRPGGHRQVGEKGVATHKKSARRRRAWICFQDESGFSLLPVVRATWAPRGQTPVLTHRFSWKRLSMSGALAYRPDRSEAVFVFGIKEGAYNTASLIEFLTALHEHLDGQKVTLIWDGLPAHRSNDMKAWLTTQRHWLHVEPLPGYAPDLNPMETVWGNVKARELANLCPDTLDEAHTAAQTGLERVGSSYQLCFNFLDHTGLSL
ncbi:IS630 family transposase [Kibdelosporangium philippinense]|uniref:IS630 family transposase n=1 Tax=Kibdelosporangium philippinense TaxID=211113 RepID=A0ABS8ZG80_9PSEU|nr:IS630 family transposase [Kibdelosporangium philippinense]